MIGDVYAVAWKEWKELLFPGGGIRSARIRLLLYLAVFGMVVPARWGEEIFAGTTPVLIWGLLPVMLILNVAGDSFAGERERHTLETLLASRLPEKAILLGKLCGFVAYGCAVTFACLIAALITVNIAHADVGGPVVPTAGQAGWILGLGFLTGWFAAGAAVVVSLRASTVREVQQLLGIGLTILVSVGFVAYYQLSAAAARSMPDSCSLGMGHLLELGAAGLLVLNLGLFGTAVALFERRRMLLS